MHVDDKDLVATLSQQADGPPITAAVYARVGTAVSFTRWLGPLGNYLIARPAARAAAQRQGERADCRWTPRSSSGSRRARCMCGPPTRCSARFTTTSAA